MTKYRYMVIHEGTVEAADEEDAAAHAVILCDGGFAATTAVQVEALGERGSDGNTDN